MADFNEYKGVWVFCEQRQGALMSTDFELVSEARKLAESIQLKRKKVEKRNVFYC